MIKNLKIYNIYNILIKIIIVELIFIIYFRLVINLAENSTLKTGRKITPDRIPSTSQPTDFLVQFFFSVFFYSFVLGLFTEPLSIQLYVRKNNVSNNLELAFLKNKK